MPQSVVSEGWKKLNPAQRQQAMARMTPEQKQILAKDLGYQGQTEEKTPQEKYKELNGKEMPSIGAAPSWGRQLETLIEHPIASIDSAVENPLHRPRNASMEEMVGTDTSNLIRGAGSVARHPLNTIKGMLSQGFGARPIIENLENFALKEAGKPERWKTSPIIPRNPEEGAYGIGQGLMTAGLLKGVP